MNCPDPVAVLKGTRTGHICDSCNRGVRTGDIVRAYATFYEDDGWRLRRLWCEECGNSTIESETTDVDEAIIEAVFWDHRLAGIQILDRRASDSSRR